MSRIESFSFVPPDLVRVIGDHLDEFDGASATGVDESGVHQAAVTQLASRMIAAGMTAAPLVNAPLPGESADCSPHYVVQVLHEDDIFYVDPALEVAAQRLAPEDQRMVIDAVSEPALCFRTHELASVVNWFGGLAEVLAVPRDSAEDWAATTWDPTSYRPIPVPKEPGRTYQL
jgi:hypothetical protein